MTPDEQRTSEELVRDYWDSLVSGTPSPSSLPSPDLVKTIDLLHALDETPSPDRALIERIWWHITGEAFPAGPVPAPTPSPNGYQQLANADTTPDWIAPAARHRTALAKNGAAAFRLLAIGVLAGLVAGAIGGGLGARLAMRLSAVMAGPKLQGANTDNGNAVGVISAEGTFSLIVFSAIVLGVLGGVLFVAVRSWLPWSGWRRGLAYGGLLLITFGFVVMDPHNPDYRRFGSPLINVGSFSLVYILFGAILGPVADWLDQRLPSPSCCKPFRARDLVGFIVLAPLTMFGILMIALAAFSFGGATGRVFLALVFGAPLLRRAIQRQRDGRQRTFSGISLRSTVIGYAIFVTPCLVGLVLTVRAIAAILGTG